jgi:hypothetical protein
MDSRMIKQILDFNKKAFDNSFKAVVAIQEYTEEMMRVFWAKSTFFPADTQQVVGDWLTVYKNGLDELKKNVESRFKLIEDHLFNVAGQMESSLEAVVPKTEPAEPFQRMTKEIAADLKKPASRRQTVKKEKVPGKKTK